MSKEIGEDGGACGTSGAEDGVGGHGGEWRERRGKLGEGLLGYG